MLLLGLISLLWHFRLWWDRDKTARYLNPFHKFNSYFLVGWQENLPFEMFTWNHILSQLSLFTIAFPVSFNCRFTLFPPSSAPHLCIAPVYLIFPKQNRVFFMPPTALNTQFLTAWKCSNVVLYFTIFWVTGRNMEV